MVEFREGEETYTSEGRQEGLGRVIRERVLEEFKSIAVPSK